MVRKTHETALVWMPPEPQGSSIQAIRSTYDRKVRRWMPHITLMYPFAPRDEIDDLLSDLAPVCSRIEPFETQFNTIGWFRLRRECAVWLAPEPIHPWQALHARLIEALPGYDDTSRYANGFTPHLSIAQHKGDIQPFVDELQAHWKPLTCRVDSLALVARNAPPDDVFRVIHKIPLRIDSPNETNV